MASNGDITRKISYFSTPKPQPQAVGTQTIILKSLIFLKNTYLHAVIICFTTTFISLFAVIKNIAECYTISIRIVKCIDSIE